MKASVAARVTRTKICRPLGLGQASSIALGSVGRVFLEIEEGAFAMV